MALESATQELDDYASDVARASYQTILNALRRYVARLDAEPLASAVSSVLVPVDFDRWYEDAKSTIGSMVGSGRLDWPVDSRERVSLQAELVRRLASAQIEVIQYTYDFHYVENRFDSNVQQFIAQDFEPFHRDLMRLLRERPVGPLCPVARPDARPSVVGQGTPLTPDSDLPKKVEYIAESRLNELRALRPAAFDLRKLIQLCEEIDQCFDSQCFLAVAALTRALLDHVPPIFGCSSFTEVANNYGDGGKSFRDSMQHLQNSARKVGDAHLHVRIRNSESLPTSTQVNYANDLDVLLAEVIRILR